MLVILIDSYDSYVYYRRRHRRVRRSVTEKVSLQSSKRTLELCRLRSHVELVH